MQLQSIFILDSMLAMTAFVIANNNCMTKCVALLPSLMLDKFVSSPIHPYVSTISLFPMLDMWSLSACIAGFYSCSHYAAVWQ